MRATAPPLSAPQRQRLLVEHRLGDDLARDGGVDAVVRQQVAAVFDDGVDALPDLARLEVTGPAVPYAPPDDSTHVAEAYGPAPRVGARPAGREMIDGGKRIGAGVARRLQFA